MKFIISLILTALLSFIACVYLPWWSIAIAAFIIAIVVPQKPLASFFAAFIALLLLWGTLTFIISSNNGFVLAHKTSMIILSIDNPFALIAVTAFIGALVAAFGALTGSFVRKSPAE